MRSILAAAVAFAFLQSTSAAPLVQRSLPPALGQPFAAAPPGGANPLTSSMATPPQFAGNPLTTGMTGSSPLGSPLTSGMPSFFGQSGGLPNQLGGGMPFPPLQGLMSPNPFGSGMPSPSLQGLMSPNPLGGGMPSPSLQGLMSPNPLGGGMFGPGMSPFGMSAFPQNQINWNNRNSDFRSQSNSGTTMGPGGLNSFSTQSLSDSESSSSGSMSFKKDAAKKKDSA